jgi:hypothetical protein
MRSCLAAAATVAAVTTAAAAAAGVDVVIDILSLSLFVTGRLQRGALSLISVTHIV